MQGLTATWTTKLLCYGLATALTVGAVSGSLWMSAKVQGDVFDTLKARPKEQKPLKHRKVPAPLPVSSNEPGLTVNS